MYGPWAAPSAPMWAGSQLSLVAVVGWPGVPLTLRLSAECWTVQACEVEGIACELVVLVSRCQGSR